MHNSDLIEKFYNLNKESFFGYDSSFIQSLRKEIISNLDLNPKTIKNNESIKNFDPRIFKMLFHKIDKQFKEPRLNNFEPTFDSKIGLLTSSFEKENLVVDKVKQYQDVLQDDYLVKINTIFQNLGFIYDFKKGESGKVLINNLNQDDLIFQKNFFNINENCEICIVEKFNNKKISNMNLVNYFEIKNFSKVIHLVIQDNDVNANLQFTNYVNCYNNSQFKQIIVNTSNSSNRNHTYVNLLKENSETELKGVFFGSSDQVVDNKTVVRHVEPNCKSDQKYKGILTGQSKASYLSKTHVEKIAQKTEAYQLSKGILLSDSCYFHSKPELRIFADDVICSHGSTIGPFNEELLFYIRSRGISKKQAISLLIKSFFSDIISSLIDKEFELNVNQSISEWLNNNDY